jgi:hypothetical protein
LKTLSILTITLVPGLYIPESFQIWRPALQHRQTAIFVITAFAILGVMGALAAVAIPHAVAMMQDAKARTHEVELLKIRAAVDDMLQQSPAGKVQSIGPISDLALVHTADSPPLALTDYLSDGMASVIGPDCTYTFNEEGTVVQYHK